MILYHSADLLWATRIKKTGEAVGVACRPVRSLDMLKARLADSPVAAVIVDLDAPEVALELIRALRGSDGREPLDSARSIRILAFGPHVAVDDFAAAKAAGADTVLARGAFDRSLDRFLIELAH